MPVYEPFSNLQCYDNLACAFARTAMRAPLEMRDFNHIFDLHHNFSPPLLLPDSNGYVYDKRKKMGWKITQKATLRFEKHKPNHWIYQKKE